MSFLKINDPEKRDFIINEFLKTKQNIQKSFLSERVDHIDTQRELSKFFKPITDTQKETKESIVNEIKPLTESIKELPKAITYPTSTIKAIEDVPISTMKLGPIATEYLQAFASKSTDVDRSYGLYNKAGKFYIGDTEVQFDDNNIIVGDKEYEGTPGLWELIVSREPDRAIYGESDYDNYAEIVLQTNALKQNHDPNTNKVKSSKAWKWNNLLKSIWDNRQLNKEGSAVIVLPSDPNALAQRLDLLIASKAAGNTGVRNELVAICDELLRQKVIDNESYKKILAHIKNADSEEARL